MILDKKIINGILLFIGLYSFISILIGAYYAYPNAEDLSVAMLARDKGILNGIVYLLQTFDGRYTTNLLHGLNPLAFDFYYGNKIMPIITFGLLTWALFTFLTNQFREKRKAENGLYAFVFVSLFFSVLDLSQSLYWMICSFVYIYPLIFFLFFYSFFLKYRQSSRIRDYVLSLLFLFLSVGCCELYIPVFGIILILLFFHFIKDSQHRQTMTWYLIVYISSSLLFITSPGITYRLGVYNNLRSEVFNDLFYKAFDYSLSSFSSWTYLPLILFLILFSLKYYHSLEVKYRVLILFLGLSTIFFIWTTVLLLMGNSGFSTRILPLPVFILLVTLLFILPNYSDYLFSKKKYLAIGLFVLFIYFDNSYSRIYKDFHSGKLTHFKQEMDLQYAQLRNAKKDSCLSIVFIKNITPLLPSSIASQPYIKSNRYGKTKQGEWHAEWYNVYETYFRVDEVRLEGDTINLIERIYESKK